MMGPEARERWTKALPTLTPCGQGMTLQSTHTLQIKTLIWTATSILCNVNTTIKKHQSHPCHFYFILVPLHLTQRLSQKKIKGN